MARAKLCSDKMKIGKSVWKLNLKKRYFHSVIMVATRKQSATNSAFNNNNY